MTTAPTALALVLDDLDAAAQPRCPECATMLQDRPPGFACGWCDLLFVRDLPSRSAL